jgi:hypothetical protein
MNALPKLVSPDPAPDPIMALTFDELCELVYALHARIDALEAELRGRRQAIREDLPPRPPGEWVTRKEAAYQTGQCVSWVRKWQRKGAIPRHDEGGIVLVDLEAALRLAACARTTLMCTGKTLNPGV